MKFGSGFQSRFTEGKHDFSSGFGNKVDKKKDSGRRTKKPEIYQKTPDVNDESQKYRREAREKAAAHAAEQRAQELHAAQLDSLKRKDDDDDE